jgi:histidine phosphotransferase ChpT
MTIDPVEFASLLCSRLCHDLLSPIGALNNGLELLADETDPAMRERCMELMAESARTSAAKLKFFRLAFGAAGGFGEAVDTREAQQAIEGLFGETKRLQVNWMVEEPMMPKAAIKVLLNMAMIAGDTLVRGGSLDIGSEANENAIEIVLKVEGPRITLDEELRSTLVEGQASEAITPRAAAAFLVHEMVKSAQGRVLVSAPADNVMLFGATMRPQ